MADYSFETQTYFFFPVKTEKPDELYRFLKTSDDWKIREVTDVPWETGEKQVHGSLEPQYLMSYASALLKDDTKYCEWKYQKQQELHFPHFANRLKYRTESCTTKSGEKIEGSGNRVSFKDVVLHVFGTNVCFLEVRVGYDGMTIDEICEFVYLFRSLRNDLEMSAKYLRFEEGEEAVIDIIRRILPFEKAQLELCFSNPSPVKSQAVIFTMVDAKHLPSLKGADVETLNKYRYRLAHGYNNDFEYVSPENQSGYEVLSNREFLQQYELLYNISSETYYGGSQDAVVCISENPFPFQYSQLNVDMRYSLLIMLNQRFASLRYISELAKNDHGEDICEKIYDNVIELKTKYSFRVISDDRVVQNVYYKLSSIFELDDLMRDIEEVNDKLIRVKQKNELERQEKSERFTNTLLFALSFLAVFSAWIDFSNYMEDFSSFKKYRLISLFVVPLSVAFIIGMVFLVK